MTHQVHRKGDTLEIQLTGRIDQTGLANLKTTLGLAEAAKARQVDLDFAGVSYIGSTGIALLVQFYKHLNQSGGKLRVRNLSSNIQEVFRTLKLDKVFDF
ncbi:MAG: STAS domain-containing protein [Desulfarculus sp.]|nr:STAS domain-containing protein [Desulfarculus sp.]